jgi:O-antigen ligase
MHPEHFSRIHDSFPVFLTTVVVMALFSLVLLNMGGNARIKRRMYTAVVVIGTLLFAGFLWYWWFPLQPWLLVVVYPIVLIIAILNMRTMRFCPVCGKAYRVGFLGRYPGCPRCNPV